MSWHKFAKIGIEQIWINRIINDIWPNVRKYLHSSLHHQVIQEGFISVKIEDFDIGKSPAIVKTIYSTSMRDIDKHFLIFDVMFEFFSKSDFKISLSFARYIKIGITSLSIKGKARIILMIKSRLEVQRLKFTIVETPNVAHCESIGLLKWFSLFCGLESFIETLFDSYLVLPKSVTIELVENDGQKEINLNKAKGTVRIDILYANQVVFRQKDLISGRKPNCFCTVKLGKSEKYETKLCRANENPIWNEYFLFPVSTRHLSLQIELFDSVEEKDELIFAYNCEDISKNFVPINGKEFSVKLSNSNSGLQSGTLTFRVNLLDVSEMREGIHKRLALAKHAFPMGIMVILVDNASGVQSLPTNDPLHSQTLKTFVRVNIGHQWRSTELSQGNNPNWQRVMHFICFATQFQNANFSLYARILNTSYLLGSCDMPLEFVLRSQNLEYRAKLRLNGVAREATLNLIFKYKPTSYHRTFLKEYIASIKRTQKMMRSEPLIERRKFDYEIKPLVADKLIGKQITDQNVRILLRFSWLRMKQQEPKFVIDVLEAKNIPKINGRYPDPYVIIELLDNGVVVEKRVTVTKMATSHPIYNETKYFRSVDYTAAGLTRRYSFRVSVYFKVTTKSIFNKIAAETIEFPKQLQEDVDYYQHWFALSTSHRYTEGIVFMKEATDFEEGEEKEAIEDISQLFEDKEQSQQLNSKESRFTKIFNYFLGKK
ncbi:hypothetical protein B4U79_16433 [Dinothrombium tinctorium]|uniref:C2 domain-containing protein n=1 Tax=Dinothrombium tinctorium TaxID=1965070 RepID=A0A3S3P9U8_9ACAR|nr:hypothetical protein B4U79_16480 [Dinothrombium tinctorium]RWS03856.1 hypothetical protein B4U79_16469 [Dinothrombium tinctorium]RWS04238.1 hypothetical protein B4U79_16433 [Dinothrombium tinctorium]